MNEEHTQPTDDEEIIASDDEMLVDEIEVESSEPDDEMLDADEIDIDVESSELDGETLDTNEIDVESSEPNDEMLDADGLEDESEISLPAPSSDELEIDAALAAVSQLNLLTQDEIEDNISDGEYEEISEFTRSNDSVAEYAIDFEQPQELSMSRGQLASVIPAFALIILGGWLTFTLTTTETAPSASLLFALLLIGGGVIFLSQWLTSARWSRGNFFFGTSLILIGGIQLYLTQISPSMLAIGWTLWIVAIGIALLGTGLVAVPRLTRISIMGIVTIVAGGIAYVLTSGAIDPTVIGFISNLWIVGVVIVVFMIFAPLIRRRQ